LTQLPTRFAQSLVGDAIDNPGQGESARALERLDESDRLVVEDVIV
jgi:hypothetical protein